MDDKDQNFDFAKKSNKPNSITSKTKQAKFNPWVGISKDVTLFLFHVIVRLQF